MPFHSLSTISSHEVIPGFHLQPVHSERTTHAFVTIEKDAVLPEHSHEHEQISTLLKGEFEMTINGETQLLKPGMVTVIPSNAPHSGKAITDCKILDVFAPVREEYRF